MNYIATDEVHEIQDVVALTDDGIEPRANCPRCTSTTCYEEIVCDDYHEHVNYRCTNCNALIGQEF